MRTVQEFKDPALKVKPSKWIVHRCGMCDYPCGYVFSHDYERVGYDSGCDCTAYDCIKPSSYDDLCNHYNRQSSPEYIEKMNKFWGFADE